MELICTCEDTCAVWCGASADFYAPLGQAGLTPSMLHTELCGRLGRFMTALKSAFPKVKSGGEGVSGGKEERKGGEEECGGRGWVCSGCYMIMLLLVHEHYEYKTHINTYPIHLLTLFIHSHWHSVHVCLVRNVLPTPMDATVTGPSHCRLVAEGHGTPLSTSVASAEVFISCAFVTALNSAPPTTCRQSVRGSGLWVRRSNEDVV
jgi:hypothetical protein